MSRKTFNTVKSYFVFFLCFFLFACKSGGADAFFGGTEDLPDRVQHLVALLERTEEEEHIFATRKEIAKELKMSGQRKRLIVFLSSIVEPSVTGFSTSKSTKVAEPAKADGKYNSYFFLMLANEYLEAKMPEVAAYYFERVLSSKYDLIIEGKSLKLISLNSLIKTTKDAASLVNYYSLLIRDFSDEINLPYNLFMLARVYERVGEWKLAIQTYAKFLSLEDFDVVVPGIPDSFNYAKRIVDYSSSSKNWTVESLEDLVNIIRYAVRSKDYTLLEKYRSKVNFFAMSWKEEAGQHYPKTDYSIYNLMYSGNIQVAPSVDSSSTPYEVYLRTTGWAHYSKTWYFYLKKINFPADPSIHGRWEWAGIYYGEKL